MNINDIEIRVKGCTQDQINNYRDVLHGLLSVGGLDGVKNGKTIINFDGEGLFTYIQLDYVPWRRRKKE